MNTRIGRWVYGDGPTNTESLVRFMDERLKELERELGQWQRAISFGPVPGAYFPVGLRVYTGATLIANNEGIPLELNFNLKPRFITASCRGGEVTLQLRDGTTNLLAAALDTSSSPPWFNVGSAFSTMTIAKPSSLRLRVMSVVSGTPTDLEALVVFSHCQKVDDPQV